MDYKKTLSTILKILKQNSKEKICIFIDGQWGIGKTFTLTEFQEVNKKEYDVKYVSVFGKEDLKSIERDIILQILPKISLKKDNQINDNPKKTKFKMVANLVKNIGELASGLEFSKIIDNFSIESFTSKSNIIICIDDLERKSKNIELKDLLGLIERTSSKFNVILIGSSMNFDVDSKTEFISFKEKIIDFSFLVDELSNETLEIIIDSKISIINSVDKEIIIETFRENRVSKDISLNNLRVFKKYIDLIKRLDIEVNRLFNTNIFNLDKELIELCNYINNNNYLETDPNSHKIDKYLNFYKQGLKGVIGRISRYEEYDENEIKEYYEDYSEIQSDIRKLRIAFKLTKEGMDKIFVKIGEKIEEEDLTYFIKQRRVLTLYDVIKKMGVIKEYESGLFNIIEKLYIPKIGESPEVFTHTDWNDLTYFEEVENYGLETIIAHVNDYNTKTYKRYLNEQLWLFLENGDMENALRVMECINIEDEITFKRIFDWAFSKLDVIFVENIWKLLISLINRTDSDVVHKFISNIKACEKDYIRSCRLDVLQEELNEKMYYEHYEHENN